MSNKNRDYKNFYHFFGRIIGLAIFNKKYLSVNFTFLFYKKLLNKPVEFSDMEYVDPVLYKNMKWLLYGKKLIYNVIYK